jgi:lipopolysaccharide/colanic/teichoic acid biosynthesis glycosyltransferase
MKRAIDFACALLALIVLSPLLLLISLMVMMTSPGPIIFRQKRVGIHGTHFKMYKFRTMRSDAPRDVPTHLLSGAGDHITPLGRLLRKASLDELPQLLNILKGDMSIVGPRPALWNQHDLLRERERYGANGIRPGLTGWAQVNGRDELSISEKAALDGYYIRNKGFLLDLKCLLGSVLTVAKAGGVVEGAASAAGNARKKICFVTTIPFTMQAFILDTAVYLHANADLDIVLICSYEENFAAELPDNIRYIPVPMKRGIDPRGFVTALTLWTLFRREGFDLVQYSTPNAALYSSVAAKLAGVPIRLYAQMGVIYIGFSGLKRTIFKTIERLTCALSTDIDSVSRGNLRFCQAEGLYAAEKSYVVWNGSSDGVDLGRFDISRSPEWRSGTRQMLGLPEDAVVFGFVGRITRDKGVDELLGAFRELLSAHRGSYLILVGDPENLGSIDTRLYGWAVREPHVVFCGYAGDVEEYFAAMDVFVLPSYREGFGSVIIEAEAMGLPVIVSDIPGPTDAMIPDVTGLLVRKQSVSSLLEAMQVMIADDDLRGAMGHAGHEYAVRNFDHNVLMSHILADRQRLMGRS